MTALDALFSNSWLPRLRVASGIGDILDRIRARQRALALCDDDKLCNESRSLRDRIQSPAIPLADTIEAFALADEAAWRSIGMRYYDVQFRAGLSLLRNEVAEMKTGEGKTLVGALVGYTRAIQGHGVHFMTTNSYLATRDHEIIQPMLARLGITAGLLQRECTPEQKRVAYQCDITYGPGYEFGFDYLRDQLAMTQQRKLRLGERLASMSRGDSTPQPLQREHFCAIVDEADSVMIDEATTPLVLAGHQEVAAKHPEPYLLAARAAAQLQVGADFTVDERGGAAALTKEGHHHAAQMLDEHSRRQLKRPWIVYVQQAIQALQMMHRDQHYVVSDDSIKIVDPNTGRIFEDRTWSDGLHQAVETKEGVTITDENPSMARISRQQYFRLYENFCGMTGTATDCAAELRHVYKLSVTPIPTHRRCHRVTLPMRCFATTSAKWDAIADSVHQMHQSERPILIGTRTIANSETIAERLGGLSFVLLNGKQDADEARIVAEAGARGAITIATNMAGRGTDIKLGSSVAELGGLHVIISEPHESARVDRQLAGRGSRQGDPGSCQTFVSADDELIRRHAPWMNRFIRRTAGADGEVDADLGRQIARIQKTAERSAAAERCQMFSNEQRLEDTLETIARH